MKDLTVIRKLLENPLKLGREFSRKTIKPKTILDLLAYYPNMVYHLSDSKYGKLLFNNPKAVAKQAEKELIEKIIQKHKLNPEAASLLRRKVSKLKMPQAQYNRYKSIIDKAYEEYLQQKDSVRRGVNFYLELYKFKKQLEKSYVETKLFSADAIEACFNQLLEYTYWMNSTYGYYPLILGSWATYYYYPHYGGIMLETLLPNKQIADDVLTTFYMAAGYTGGGLWEKWYYKDVFKNNKRYRIFLLAYHADDPNIFNEDPAIELPFSLLQKDTKVWRIAGYRMRVPSKEIHLLFKVFQLRERQYDLKHKKGGRLQKILLKELIEHDKKEIVALVDYTKPKVNVIKLRKLLEKYKFTKYFSETLADLDIDLKKDFKF